MKWIIQNWTLMLILAMSIYIPISLMMLTIVQGSAVSSAAGIWETVICRLFTEKCDRESYGVIGWTSVVFYRLFLAFVINMAAINGCLCFMVVWHWIFVYIYIGTEWCRHFT